MTTDANTLHDLTQPGDWRIASAIALHRDFVEIYTVEEVTAWLRDNPITDEDLAEVFGPRWRQIIALLRRAAVLTEKEAKALVAAWETAPETARRAAQDAAADAVRATARAALNAATDTAQDAVRANSRAIGSNAAADAVWDAGWAAGWARMRGGAQYPVWDAAEALIVADLVGQHGLKQHHLDILLAPWRKVFGDPLELPNHRVNVAVRWRRLLTLTRAYLYTAYKRLS